SPKSRRRAPPPDGWCWASPEHRNFGLTAELHLAAMTFARLLAALSLAAAFLPATALAQADKSVVTTDHVRAELLAHAPDGLEAGKPAWLGLKITHKPEWHTYWKNPGD